MKYIVETQLPDYDDWYPAIDLELSKVRPAVRKFDTREAAEAWAEKHSIPNHKWRVVEDEVAY